MKLTLAAINWMEMLSMLHSKLQVLSLKSNPIGKGGAVEILEYLHNCKTPLKEFNLANTGVGEEDCAQLALLMANTDTVGDTLYQGQ